jgi:hypothetical protein
MTSANIKHVFHQFLKRAEHYLLALGAERRCAMRLDRIGDRLLAMGERINVLRERMDGGFVNEPVDADRTLRASLKGLKEDIRDVRCQLASMHTPQLGPRLQRAFARLAKIAEETYSSADKLQWQIDEHDMKFAG